MARNGRRDNDGDLDYGREGARLAAELYAIDDRADNWGKVGFYIKAIRLIPPRERGGDWLAVVAASSNGEDVVSFSTGTELIVVLHVMAARLLNGSMKWLEDKYAKRE